jgi:FkbM family methyltransferase
MYKKISPDFFPPTWDVASDIERIRGGRKPETIFDVGSNIGQMAGYFHQKIPRADIFCFEPIGESYRQLSNSFTDHQQIQCFQLALRARPEEKTIILNPNSQQNFLLDGLTESKGDSEKSEIVHIEALDNFCGERGIENIDLLKIDTEGYELEVFQGAARFLEERSR